MSRNLLHYGSDNLVTVRRLRDSDNNPVENATVSAKVMNENGTELTTITLVHKSNGTYQGTIPHDIDVEEGQRVTVGITAETDSATRYWEDEMFVFKDKF